MGCNGSSILVPSLPLQQRLAERTCSPGNSQKAGRGVRQRAGQQAGRKPCTNKCHMTGRPTHEKTAAAGSHLRSGQMWQLRHAKRARLRRCRQAGRRRHEGRMLLLRLQLLLRHNADRAVPRLKVGVPRRHLGTAVELRVARGQWRRQLLSSSATAGSRMRLLLWRFSCTGCHAGCVTYTRRPAFGAAREQVPADACELGQGFRSSSGAQSGTVTMQASDNDSNELQASTSTTSQSLYAKRETVVSRMGQAEGLALGRLRWGRVPAWRRQSRGWGSC